MGINKNKLEMLQVLGCFKGIEIERCMTREAFDDRFWNIKKSIHYINKICDLRKLNNRDKVISELLICEGRFRNVFFSRTIYNILSIDLNKLDTSYMVIYFLKHHRDNIVKWLNILNESDSIKGYTAYAKLEKCVTGYGMRLLEYLWDCDGYEDVYDRILLYYKEDLREYELYRLNGKSFYRFKQEGLKDNSEYRELFDLDEHWIKLGHSDKISGLDKYKDVYLMNGVVDIENVKMVF